jgi:hypothetical protein
MTSLPGAFNDQLTGAPLEACACGDAAGVLYETCVAEGTVGVLLGACVGTDAAGTGAALESVGGRGCACTGGWEAAQPATLAASSTRLVTLAVAIGVRMVRVHIR